MLSNKTDSRILHTKQCLLEALIILLTRKPFEDISIKEITDKAGVSRTTFYSHYDKKEDIIIEHLQYFLSTIYNKIKDVHDIETINATTALYLQENEAFITILFQSNLDYLLLRQLELFFNSCISNIIQINPLLLCELNLDSNIISTEDLSTFLAGGIYSVAKKALLTKDYSHIHTYSKLLTHILTPLTIPKP